MSSRKPGISQPRQSRLMHGAGIASLGFLMDTIFDRYIRVRVPGEHDFEKDLTPLKTVCRWTTGLWDFGPHSQRKWNELQNTTKDIQVLSEYLINEYKTRVWSTPLDEGEATNGSSHSLADLGDCGVPGEPGSLVVPG